MKPRSEWIADLQDRLDELDLQIGELQARAALEKAVAKRKMHARVDALKEKRDAARSKLLEVKEAGESAWDRLRDGAGKVWQQVEDTLRETKRAFAEGRSKGEP